MSIFDKIFTTNGRLNRLRYLKYMILLALVASISTFILSSMMMYFTGCAPDSPQVMLVTLMWALIAGAGNVMMMIRRLHDLGKHGILWLIALIPVLGAIFSIYLFCAPGQVGWNQFGADPLTEDD